MPSPHLPITIPIYLYSCNNSSAILIGSTEIAARLSAPLGNVKASAFIKFKESGLLPINAKIERFVLGTEDELLQDDGKSLKELGMKDGTTLASTHLVLR